MCGKQILKNMIQAVLVSQIATLTQKKLTRFITNITNNMSWLTKLGLME